MPSGEGYMGGRVCSVVVVGVTLLFFRTRGIMMMMATIVIHSIQTYIDKWLDDKHVNNREKTNKKEKDM